MKYISKTFEFIRSEIEAAKPKQLNSSSKQVVFTPAIEVLHCIKSLFRSYGDEFRSYFNAQENYDMVVFTNDLFYFGFNKNLIETLTELSKICKGQYKGITQIKLLNTISIILTQKTSPFPLGADNLKKPRQETPDDKSGQQSPANNVLANARKGSDSSTVFGEGRKQSSLDTTSMVFN